MSDYPEIDPKELHERKKRNFEERLAFIDKYVEWQKKTSNKSWSTAQKKLIGSRKK